MMSSRPRSPSSWRISALRQLPLLLSNMPDGDGHDNGWEDDR